MLSSVSELVGGGKWVGRQEMASKVLERPISWLGDLRSLTGRLLAAGFDGPAHDSHADEQAAAERRQAMKESSIAGRRGNRQIPLL